MTAASSRLALINPRTTRRADHPSTSPASRLDFPADTERLNHRIFRFPARFHPPVVRRLLEVYSRPGEVVLDPFCGSGTVPVEALFAGRAAIGTDIDPLSILVTRAKARTYDLGILNAATESLRGELARMREADERIWGRFDLEIGLADYEAASSLLAEHIPALPNALHWFRRRVMVQLAAIRAKVETHIFSPAYPLLQLCFASIIRNASNADPVPVSSLEVTRHMRDKEANGRSIDPYGLLDAVLHKALDSTRGFQERRQSGTAARIVRADARHLSVRGTGRVDCVITSPPYLAAVDYYRRHTLEMYWLGLTESASERLDLMSSYLGRDRVGLRHMDGADGTRGAAIARRWLAGMPAVRPERERAFLHYCSGMGEVLTRLCEVTRVGAPVLVVVGNVRFNGCLVSIPDLLTQLAPRGLALEQRLWYPLENRYMSYERQNGADIDVDHVLVFRAGA